MAKLRVERPESELDNEVSVSDSGFRVMLVREDLMAALERESRSLGMSVGDLLAESVAEFVRKKRGL